MSYDCFLGPMKNFFLGNREAPIGTLWHMCYALPRATSLQKMLEKMQGTLFWILHNVRKVSVFSLPELPCVHPVESFGKIFFLRCSERPASVVSSEKKVIRK